MRWDVDKLMFWITACQVLYESVPSNFKMIKVLEITHYYSGVFTKNKDKSCP